MCNFQHEVALNLDLLVFFPLFALRVESHGVSETQRLNCR